MKCKLIFEDLLEEEDKKEINYAICILFGPFNSINWIDNKTVDIRYENGLKVFLDS